MPSIESNRDLMKKCREKLRVDFRDIQQNWMMIYNMLDDNQHEYDLQIVLSMMTVFDSILELDTNWIT